MAEIAYKKGVEDSAREEAADELEQLRTELEAARAKLAEYEARDKKFIESINIAFEPKEKQP